MDELCSFQKTCDVPVESNLDNSSCQSTNDSQTLVYMCPTCIAHERVRNAASRLGVVRSLPEQLPNELPIQSTPPYLVTTPFEGDLFDAAHKVKYRILGPTAVLQLAERDDQTPSCSRPLYSLAMRGVVICFTGFRKKDELTYLITLIHYMGGSIRKDMSAKVTHLIANCSGGEKYRYACAFRLPVLARSWVDACWQRRDDETAFASDPALINEHKLKVFVGARVCFVGFTCEETEHMAEVLRDNGGESCAIEDASCTHVVMANGETFARLSYYTSPETPSTPCLSPPLSKEKPSRTNGKPSLYRRLSARLSRNSFRSKNDSNVSPRDESKLEQSIEEKENLSEEKNNVTPIDDKNSTRFSLFYPEVGAEELPLNLPSLSGASELHRSTTTLSSGKKRSRNSSETNLQVCDAVGLSPDKETDWKSPFKKLKIKDSFKFKTRPTIFKREKKNEKSSKLASPDFCKATSSPNPEDDDSFGSLNTSKQSGFFDMSLASIKSSRTAKSASKLRRSVKSFTASFRSERKKKYTKREPEISGLSTPTRLISNSDFDISPVEIVSELRDDEIFKTPVSTRGISLRRQSSSVIMTPPPSLPRSSSHRTSLAKDPIDGAATSLLFDGCQPLVIDEHAPSVEMRLASDSRPNYVRAEWFWASVQNEEAQDEKDYAYKDPSADSSRSVSGSPGASPRVMRKRKMRGPHASQALNKRRSSVGDAVLLSLSSNLLDTTPANDIIPIQESEEADSVVRKLMSPRQQVFMELVQTECNYVNILHTIVTLFKQPLEVMIEGGIEDDSKQQQPLLNNTELKIIFGNLQPIYELHRRMLEELHYASCKWSEEFSIGKLVLQYAPDMVKAYPPFVNFFENTKEMLQQCDRENPRFHAFLKICQSRPECGRQTLQELLIRPVQRLPSISLLLEDILKHTPKSNGDHAALVAALAGIKEVMTHINEDKRRTEGQMQMFDIYNDIEQCPAQLVSSHRSFVSRCEVVELSKELSGRGDHLTLFLFTDTMEVCKRKTKVFNNKSPPAGTGPGALLRGSGKMYRHLQLMPLSTVKRVVNIREADDCHNVFALMCRSNQELKERLYSFMITDETRKDTFLRQLCRQMANTVCKADADKFLACLDSHQLDIDTSDLALGTLSKAFKFATRTRIKLEAALGGGWRAGGSTEDAPPLGFNQWVGRAFSFNKTPSKLKRAVSSMISPFGSTANLTPASQLAQMRLASCNNINELGSSNSNLVPPMSVQPQRKATAPR